jgi:hypothetical protein
MRCSPGKAGGRGRPKPDSLCAEKTHKLSGRRPNRTSTAIAKKQNLPERKLRHAAHIKKADPKLAGMVLSGAVKLNEAKKLAGLAPEARKVSNFLIQAVDNSR